MVDYYWSSCLGFLTKSVYPASHSFYDLCKASGLGKISLDSKVHSIIYLLLQNYRI